ncbi:dienelactone hydrolase family protein [Paenibacillus sp. 2RAB27]|uniref:dienelactone hydrolase family protein n=1 Tax=Paenibacillus sp. 2RAB27 TaxID=3232991 RepID=UPI003F970D30
MSYKLSERNQGNIPHLLDRIETVGQWEFKRESIKAAWLKVLGTPPDSFAAASAIGYEIMREEAMPDHRRLDIRYATFDGDQVEATLLLPNPYVFGEGKHPAVLALHPTASEGRLDIATPSGRKNRLYGLELVSRGYVVLAPDAITSGSRIYPGSEAFQSAPFYERNPRWTVVSKMLFDHMRAVDILCSVQEADSERIGAIGHSLGGYNSWFLAGLDERIRAVASSCGFSMFTDDPDPNRWGQRDWFSHFPSISDDLREDRIPFEWHEIAALAAPTPLWMWSGISDHIFPNWSAIACGMRDLDSLYKLLGRENSFTFWMGNAGHDFPEEARQLAYRFLDLHLGYHPKNA